MQITLKHHRCAARREPQPALDSGAHDHPVKLDNPSLQTLEKPANVQPKLTVTNHSIQRISHPEQEILAIHPSEKFSTIHSNHPFSHAFPASGDVCKIPHPHKSVIPALAAEPAPGLNGGISP